MGNVSPRPTLRLGTTLSFIVSPSTKLWVVVFAAATFVDTVVIILSFAMYVLLINDDLIGILMSLILVIICGVITIVMIN